MPTFAASKSVLVALLTVLAFPAMPAAASAALRTVGLAGWQVQSSSKASEPDRLVSRPGFATGAWLHVRPDSAGAAGTEVGALVQTGHCPNVFFSTNLKSCFGYMSQVGRDTIPMFRVPWWFRTTFPSSLGRSQHAQLIVNGVVGTADVWLNGIRIATRATVQGDNTRYAFDVTRLLRRGTNALALKLYPNDPTKMFTLDNVDWTQIPPDNNTGIQFPIQLHTSGPLALSGVHVVQHDSPGFSRARLTIKGLVRNESPATRTGSVVARLTGRSRGFAVGETIRVPAGAARAVSFGLVIPHPRVWWPYQMGSQPLYRLTMSVRQPGQPADSESETFGIRTVTTRLVGASPLAPHGSRQFVVNGRPFVFRGGGWSEDLFLRYSAADTAAQIATIKNLGLNGIRTEGKQMPEDSMSRWTAPGS